MENKYVFECLMWGVRGEELVVNLNLHLDLIV